MRDVIQKVIATEAVAKQMVQAAKSEAERILSEAQKQAQELTASTKREVDLEVQIILATAAQDAEADKQQCLAAIAEKMEKQVYLDAEVRQQVLDAVVRCMGVNR